MPTETIKYLNPIVNLVLSLSVLWFSRTMVKRGVVGLNESFSETVMKGPHKKIGLLIYASHA